MTTAETIETAARIASPSPPVLKEGAGEGRGEGASVNAAPEAAKPPQLDPEKLAALEAASAKLLGQVTWLLSLSPQHRYMFLADLDWRIRPAILLRQCRLFEAKGRPVAFVSWAYVSDEVAGRLQLMPGRLQPQEWRSGPKFMLVDVVAPFGGAEQIVQEVIKQHGRGPAATKSAGTQ